MSQLDLFEDEEVAPPSPPPGWRAVTMREFYDAIGQLDCDPEPTGKFPFDSIFRTRDRRVVGMGLGYMRDGLSAKAYMLPLTQETQP